MSVVLQTGVMYYRENQSDDWHPLILKVDADLSALIEDYSQRAWDLGEYCRNASVIYRCTTAITTPEVWDSTHWQETTIGEELKNITDITGDGDLDSGFTASDLTGAANELKTALNAATTITDVTNLITADSTNTYTNNSTGFKIGRLVIINVSFRTNSLSDINNKQFLRLDNSITPNGVYNFSGILTPDITDFFTTFKPCPIRATSGGTIGTLNAGGYSNIGAVTTNTMITGLLVYFI